MYTCAPIEDQVQLITKNMSIFSQIAGYTYTHIACSGRTA